MAAWDRSSPPNSLEAIRSCLDVGADVIEIDVMPLASDDYLLVHDPDLESETTGYGAVDGTAVDETRRLRIKVSGVATGTHVPLLSEVVTAICEHPGMTTRLQVDFKSSAPFIDDEPLRRLVRLIAPLENRVIVSSKADWHLRRLHRIAPQLDLGFDVELYLRSKAVGTSCGEPAPPFSVGAYGYLDDTPLAARRAWQTAEYLAERCDQLASASPGVSTLYIEHGLLLRSLDDGFNWAESLHAKGLQLCAWTIDSAEPDAAETLQRLTRADVDQITTNTPASIRQAIVAEESGLRDATNGVRA